MDRLAGLSQIAQRAAEQFRRKPPSPTSAASRGGGFEPVVSGSGIGIATGTPIDIKPAVARTNGAIAPPTETIQTPEKPGSALIAKAKEMIMKEAGKPDGKFAAKSDALIAKDAETQLQSLAEQVKQGKVTQADYDKQMKALVDKLTDEQKKLQAAIEIVTKMNGQGQLDVQENFDARGYKLERTNQISALPETVDLLNRLGPDGQALTTQIIDTLQINPDGKTPLSFKQYFGAKFKPSANPAEDKKTVDRLFDEFLQNASFPVETSPQTQEANQLPIQEKNLENDQGLCFSGIHFLEKYLDHKDAKVAQQANDLMLELLIASESKKGEFSAENENPMALVALHRFRDFITHNTLEKATAHSFAYLEKLKTRVSFLDGARSEKRIGELSDLESRSQLDESGKKELADARKVGSFLEDATKQTLAYLETQTGKELNPEQIKLVNIMFAPDENHHIHFSEVVAGMVAESRLKKPGEFGKALNHIRVFDKHPDIKTDLKNNRDTINIMLARILQENQEKLENILDNNPQLLTPQERGILAMINRYKNMFGGAFAIAILGQIDTTMNIGVDKVEPGQPAYATH